MRVYIPLAWQPCHMGMEIAGDSLPTSPEKAMRSSRGTPKYTASLVIVSGSGWTPWRARDTVSGDKPAYFASALALFSPRLSIFKRNQSASGMGLLTSVLSIRRVSIILAHIS